MAEPPAERVKQIFNRALDLAPDERAAFLDRACADDTGLRGRVERLLGSLDRAGTFLASPTQTAPTDGATLHGPRLDPGSTLGNRYRIVELAATGGMGQVYRAEDLELGQTVALKLIPEQVGQDPKRLALLRAEVRVARQVSHPNVCRVYDIGEADGRHFLSMEWIEGRDLESVLRVEGRLPADRAAFLARQICAGVAAAHDRGVVHRDLKPSNVMLDERDVVRITDFGLAEVATVVRGARAREGTPRYMSPEQLDGRDVGLASDIYSLGLVLYELFTGRPVHSGDSLEEITQSHRKAPTPPSRLAPQIDRRVERLILRCLAEDPKRRPLSARDLADALPRGGSFERALSFAQQRADRIAAFRAEVAELRRAGLLDIGEDELRAVDRHHDRVLGDLVRNFDVDVSERGKQLSLGTRAVSFVGAFALAASVYYFFYRIWGTLPTALQLGVLGCAPLAALAVTALVARRERKGYFTLMAALVAFASLIVNTALTSITLNLAPSRFSMLAWGLFALLLAYLYRLRLLLVIGLVVLDAFLAAAVLHATGRSWSSFPMRPEGFLLGGLILLVLVLSVRRLAQAESGPTCRVLALTFLVAPTLPLGMNGSLSYLTIDERWIEIAYQLFGFATSAAAIGFGIVRRRAEVVYAGAFFFVALLFVEFVNWWWAWMPKYLFFLIVAVTSIAVAIALKRLRRLLLAESLEGRS
jgi:hypothetical protein